MAEALSIAGRRDDWPIGNPWVWMGAGLTLSAAAWIWVIALDEAATWLRMTLIVISLLAAAGAVALRLNSAQPACLDDLPPVRRRSVLNAAALACVALALAIEVVFCTLIWRQGASWDAFGTFILNLLTVPAVIYLAVHSFGRAKSGKPLGRKAEGAMLLVLAAVCVFLCCQALFLDQRRAGDWDSMRLFLGVLATFTLLGAGVWLLPGTAQKVVISALILFHFGGIVTAAMSAPPIPWVFRQLWARVYRPYLQFMYLNNAYHFYAPEPGPSCFVWFRVEYENGEKDANGDPLKLWSWIEHPKIRPDGAPDYPFALLYQRRLAMTDHTQHWETTMPAQKVIGENGKVMDNPIYFYRQVYSPDQPEGSLGRPLPKKVPIQVPFHPLIPASQQYKVPNAYSKKMIYSFAHHIFTKPHPDYPDYKPVSVKVYKVVHNIPTETMIAAGIEPTSPILYYPYYMGNFGHKGVDKEGKPLFQLLDEPVYKNGELVSGDPLLYWLVPILPNNNFDASTLNRAKIYGWVYHHAGDRNWVWYPGQTTPQEEDL